MNMKHFGCVTDYAQQRNDELLQAFIHQIAQTRIIRMPEICRKVADSPASRFWVSEERATVVISAIIAGRPLSRMRCNKREMFEEIYRRFITLREQYPYRTVPELVAEVVNSPAPKFYLTPRSVAQMIYRIRNGWYERQYKRHARHTTS